MSGLNRKTPEPEQTEYENLGEGDYEGRLVYVADLGMHVIERRDKPDINAQKISLGIELIGLTYKDGDDQEHPKVMWTNPFNIYSSLTKNGKEIEMYSAFAPSAKKGEVPDWEAQLCKPVSVRVVNVQGKGENASKVYDNIDSLSAIPAKYQTDLAACITTPAIGDSEDETNECTMALGGLAKYVWEKRVVA